MDFVIFLSRIAFNSNDNEIHVVTLVTLLSGAFSVKEGRKEMFYLMTHSTHFIYSYMGSDIW